MVPEFLVLGAAPFLGFAVFFLTAILQS